MWYGGALCVRWYTVCEGGIIGVRMVYRVLGYTLVTHSTPPYHTVHRITT